MGDRVDFINSAVQQITGIPRNVRGLPPSSISHLYTYGNSHWGLATTIDGLRCGQYLSIQAGGKWFHKYSIVLRNAQTVHIPTTFGSEGPTEETAALWKAFLTFTNLQSDFSNKRSNRIRRNDNVNRMSLLSYIILMSSVATVDFAYLFLTSQSC